MFISIILVQRRNFLKGLALAGQHPVILQFVSIDVDPIAHEAKRRLRLQSAGKHVALEMGAVTSIHFVGESVKLFEPASLLKESNSTPLNAGLIIFSHRPRNSIVERVRSQFLTTSFGSSALRTRAMSVNQLIQVCRDGGLWLPDRRQPVRRTAFPKFPPNACRGERCGVWGRTAPIKPVRFPPHQTLKSRKKSSPSPGSRSSYQAYSSDSAHELRRQSSQNAWGGFDCRINPKWESTVRSHPRPNLHTPAETP